MPAHNIVQAWRSIQYDGTNSAEINNLITDFTITNEENDVLSFDSNYRSWTANLDDWILFWQGAVQEVHPDAMYQDIYVHNAVFDDLA
jgi:hypothetical protein